MESKGILKDIARNWETGKFLLTFEMDQDITGQLEDIRGKLLNIVAKQYRKKRSLDANAYYWQLLTKLSEASGISKNRAHNLMLRRYGQLEEMDGHLIYVVVPDDDKGADRSLEAETYHIKPTTEVKVASDGTQFRTYVMLRGSSTYDTSEMSKLIDGLVSECRDLGIETLPPQEIQRMMQIYDQNCRKRVQDG